MVKYEATATLKKGSATLIINGVSTDMFIDSTIESKVIADTLSGAKQQARADVNGAALIILDIQSAAALLEPKYADDKYKGRSSINFSYWVSVNITGIKIIPE